MEPSEKIRESYIYDIYEGLFGSRPNHPSPTKDKVMDFDMIRGNGMRWLELHLQEDPEGLWMSPFDEIRRLREIIEHRETTILKRENARQAAHDSRTKWKARGERSEKQLTAVKILLAEVVALNVRWKDGGSPLNERMEKYQVTLEEIRAFLQLDQEGSSSE